MRGGIDRGRLFLDEVHRLRGRHDRQRDHVAKALGNVAELARDAVAAEHRRFLSGADDDMVAACRRARVRNVRAEASRRILHEHKAVVEFRVFDEERRQPAELRVDKALHERLDLLGKDAEGHGKRVAVGRDIGLIPARAHERRAVRQEDGIVRNALVFLHEGCVGLLDLAKGAASCARQCSPAPCCCGHAP